MAWQDESFLESLETEGPEILNDTEDSLHELDTEVSGEEMYFLDNNPFFGDW